MSRHTVCTVSWPGMDSTVAMTTTSTGDVYRVVISLLDPPSLRRRMRYSSAHDTCATDGRGWGFIEPYLPVGEYGPHPARLRTHFEGVS